MRRSRQAPADVDDPADADGKVIDDRQHRNQSGPRSSAYDTSEAVLRVWRRLAVE